MSVDPIGPDWQRPAGYKKSAARRRRWPWIVGGAAATVLVIGLIAPDDTKQVSDRAAAVVATPSADPTSSTTSQPTPTTSAETSLPAPSSAAPVANSAAAQQALTVLGTIAVKGRAARTGYSRDEFGQAWSDDVNVDGGHNGCDTRNDILRRDLTGVALKPGTRGCVVLSGTLADPYTGRDIAFTRGQGTSQAVQIDHMVALDDAWQKGAQQLSPDRRRDFANDPRNLQATDGPTNQRKGSGDAATWLPPNRAYRCTYVARQVEVKAAYGLWVTAAERDAITRVLTSCGATSPATTSEPAPTPAQRSETRTQTPIPAVPRTTDAPPPPAAPDGGGAYFGSCKAARAAGAAPLRVGEPGYRPGLDRDGDGVACE